MSLFEVGRDYTFHTIDPVPGELTRTEAVWTVASIDGTLVKLTNKFDKETILNTASIHFVKAVLISKDGFQTVVGHPRSGR